MKGEEETRTTSRRETSAEIATSAKLFVRNRKVFLNQLLNLNSSVNAQDTQT